MSTSPIEVVGRWLQNLLDPEVVNSVVAPDATYVSLNSENAELNKIMPWAGTSHGPQAFLDNLGSMFNRWENQLQVELPGQSRELAVLDPGEGHRREGDVPAVPRGQLRHRVQLPQGWLLDGPDTGWRPAIRGGSITRGERPRWVRRTIRRSTRSARSVNRGSAAKTQTVEDYMSSVLITGSGRGIGRATALELVRRRHRIIATARDPRQLSDLPVDARLQLDVTDARSVDHAIQAAGPIDVLISNAGGIFIAPVEATPPDELDRLLRQNTVGALRVAQAVLPAMRERGRGRLLFISSILGRMTSPTRGAYAATKWALEALVETLAGEVGHFGVEVALLQPSSVASGGLDNPQRYFVENDPYAALEAQMDGSVPSMTVEEVATAIADAVEARTLPLRVPIGEAARRVLAARRAAPDDTPFRLAPIVW